MADESIRILICSFILQRLSFIPSMSNFESDGTSENEWNDRGDLAWNEFDWERYLREQDETINRYLAFYETCLENPQRIDEVARHMGWDDSQWDSQESLGNDLMSSADTMAEDFPPDSEIYTLHKNPIFIATKGIYLRARRHWELLACDPNKVPQSLALIYLSSLNTGEDHAVQAIHALEFGDYAMSISLFKRALSTLNHTLALLNDASPVTARHVLAYRRDIIMSIFDLREIWLRVISECRGELQRPVDDEED